MARRELYPEDAIMDAARTAVLEHGARGATIGAIAAACQAPTGSIYHRFDSVSELLARSWMRAIRRAQAAILGSADEDVIEAAVAGALAVYDFCLREPGDALLLSCFRRSDFDAARLSDQVRGDLEQLNEGTDPFYERLARALGGGRAAGDLALLAVRDLPYGAALPHIRDGTVPPPQRRARLEAAVRAALTALPDRPGTRTTGASSHRGSKAVR
jgi:AcrR family transcriptional regulator